MRVAGVWRVGVGAAPGDVLTSPLTSPGARLALPLALPEFPATQLQAIMNQALQVGLGAAPRRLRRCALGGRTHTTCGTHR